MDGYRESMTAPRLFNHLYILATIALAVYSQMIIRWRVGLAGGLPAGLGGKVVFLWSVLAQPWTISAIVATFLSGCCWMLAMSKFEISYAYPWVSLNFVLVLVLAALIFHETLTPWKIAGCLFIILGVCCISRSS